MPRSILLSSALIRVLVSTDWESLFPACFLRALPATVSDHCPLLLSTSFCFGVKKRFRFETFWPKLDGFLDAVRRGWKDDTGRSDPLRKLDYLLRSTSKALQSWSQRSIGHIRQHILMAKDLIGCFDLAEETRLLLPLKIWFRKELKKKRLGLCSFQRIMARQRSRLN